MDPTEFKIARIRLGLTQYQLGLLLGNVPPYTVSSWETGWSKPPAEILVRFQEIIKENGNGAAEARG